MGIGTHPECRQVSVLTGVAERDLPKGTQLTVQGHHHAIDGLIPELLERTSGQDLAPFYLLNGTTLLRDVKKGDPITLEQVLEDVQQRDYNDTHRDVAPLRQAEDAVLVDTTECDLEESYQLLLKTIRERI